MVEQFKSANKHKVVFEAIRQPLPDNSPGLDDSQSIELGQSPLFNPVAELTKTISENKQTLERLQQQSLENAILISKLSEERRNLIKYYNRVKDQQYKSEISTALKISMQESVVPKNDEYTYEELLSIGERIGTVNVGYSDQEINLIPNTTIEGVETCSICLNSGEYGKVLLCGHFFHSECIEQWLRTKKSCPFCLSDVIIDKFF